MEEATSNSCLIHGDMKKNAVAIFDRGMIFSENNVKKGSLKKDKGRSTDALTLI